MVEKESTGVDSQIQYHQGKPVYALDNDSDSLESYQSENEYDKQQ